MRLPRSTLLVLLPAALAGCDDDLASPFLRDAVGGLFRPPLELEVGEVRLLSAAEAGAVVLRGGRDGAEYVYVPFNASAAATGRLALELRGTGLLPPGSPPTPAQAPAAPAIPLPDAPREDARFHLRLRQREARELKPLVGGAAALRMPSAALAADRHALGVGDTLRLNTNAEAACSDARPRQVRIAALSERAIVAEDLDNPGGGFSPEEFQHVAAVFDTLLYPVTVANFGELVYPGYLAPRDRVLLLYTRAVNELTAPGSGSYVGGFFFSRDLFPPQAQPGFEACAASNAAPILYLLAPDPAGEAGNVRSREFVLRVTLGTVAHELQHLVNQSRRLFATRAAEPFEEVWLNEGLSHIAEELVFYRATGLNPRENLDAAALAASEHVRRMFFTYQASNFGRFAEYLENPDTTSLLGIDDLPTRGASWAFLRYAADQEDGPDAAFFQRLVDGAGAGVANLAAALPVEPLDLMQSWTVAVYTDDALPGVAFAPLYQQPSWNYRSVYAALTAGPASGRYPLRVRPLTAEPQRFELKGGGAAFFRFGIPAAREAIVRITSGGSAPDERLRISLVRIR